MGVSEAHPNPGPFAHTFEPADRERLGDLVRDGSQAHMPLDVEVVTVIGDALMWCRDGNATPNVRHHILITPHPSAFAHDAMRSASLLAHVARAALDMAAKPGGDVGVALFVTPSSGAIYVLVDALHVLRIHAGEIDFTFSALFDMDDGFVVLGSNRHAIEPEFAEAFGAWVAQGRNPNAAILLGPWVHA